jgi:phosphoglycerol transferase MdoB-like AlkP superfamily enzyme
MYDNIKTLAWVGGMGSLVCILYLLWCLAKGKSATQRMYVNLYLLVLALTFVCWVLTTLYLTRVGSLNTLRTAFMTNAACITDTDWNTVFTSIVTDTALGSVYAWLVAFMVFFLLSFLFGVCVLYHVVKKLAQCQTWRT